MNSSQKNRHSYRGLLQSDDGTITRVLRADAGRIVFETAFGLRGPLAGLLQDQPEHLLFSERSRIARLGVQIESAPVREAVVKDGRALLTLTASSVIPGYPGLRELRPFFSPGLPVGRLVYCDPEALLSSEEVIEAVERSLLKLPVSTSISSDGSIVIAPHKIACRLREPLTPEALGRILLREDGREVLNRWQVRDPVPAVVIAPRQGLVTTCSMYLNEHFVVLQSGFSLGHNLAATVLDPIKTRGIRIYLEIVNQSDHPIVNPLITAKVYRAARSGVAVNGKRSAGRSFTYSELAGLRARFRRRKASNCRYISRPVAVLPQRAGGVGSAPVFLNGPEAPCPVTPAMCALARRDFSNGSNCTHAYATGRLSGALGARPAALAAHYFPNLLEHRDLVDLTCRGKVDRLYFLEPSNEHGPFLSQMDHNRLQEYHAFGLDVYWVCGLNRRLMVHTMRDRMGYFVAVDRLADFHRSMLFAFYGSNQTLVARGREPPGGPAGRADRLLGQDHRDRDRRGQRRHGAGQPAGAAPRHPVRRQLPGNHRPEHDDRRGFLPGIPVDLPPQPPEVVRDRLVPDLQRRRPRLARRGRDHALQHEAGDLRARAGDLVRHRGRQRVLERFGTAGCGDGAPRKSAGLGGRQPRDHRRPDDRHSDVPGAAAVVLKRKRVQGAKGSRGRVEGQTTREAPHVFFFH